MHLQGGFEKCAYIVSLCHVTNTQSKIRNFGVNRVNLVETNPFTKSNHQNVFIEPFSRAMTEKLQFMKRCTMTEMSDITNIGLQRGNQVFFTGTSLDLLIIQIF